MKLKCIGCEVLARAIYLSAAYSPHTVDVEMLRYGLHQHSASLRQRLQDAIDACRGQGYDAIVLAYGLCGKSTHGLVSRDIRLVMPRAHDCITLFLGSRARYDAQFAECAGTYWYVQDYLERDDGSGASLAIGANTSGDADALYTSYVEKYGRDNADYLMEVMGAWQGHYSRAALIDLGVGDASRAEARAREDARRRGWTYEKIAGDTGLIRRLLEGDWNEDFLIVQPGQQVTMSDPEQIVDAQGMTTDL
jgi:hypothetical protein